MKRDPRLVHLSEDHHHALVLARRIERAVERGQATDALGAEVVSALAGELGVHFAIEEEELLPALREAGLEATAARIASEHVALREHAEAARAGARDRLASFASLLREHVRFEEREAFPACEERLTSDVLERVRARAAARRLE
jgi:hemerythrin-like domain-containing protein